MRPWLHLLHNGLWFGVRSMPFYICVCMLCIQFSIVLEFLPCVSLHWTLVCSCHSNAVLVMVIFHCLHILFTCSLLDYRKIIMLCFFLVILSFPLCLFNVFPPIKLSIYSKNVLACIGLSVCICFSIFYSLNRCFIILGVHLEGFGWSVLKE